MAIECQICGRMIPKKNWRRNPRFCSWRCYQKEHKATYKIVNCLFCDKPIVIPNRNGRRKKYCSKECRYRAAFQYGHEYVGGNGYVYIKVKPKTYVLKHRLIMEEKLGRKLKENENVHHKNGAKTDNNPENLELFDSNSAHIKHHNAMYGGQHPKDSPNAIKKRSETRKRIRERKFAGVYG